MNHIISVEQAKTLDGLFKERVLASPQEVAYRYYDDVQESWCVHTWETMNAHIARWQAALIRESLIPGDRVAVMMRNRPEWVMFDQAALGLGLVVVPFYTEDRADNVAYMLADAGVKLLLLERSAHWHEVFGASCKVDSLQRVVLIEASGNPEAELVPEVQSIDDRRLKVLTDWLPADADATEHINDDPYSLATIIYTSGTTGRPKGVMLNHHNILSNAYGSLQAVQVNPDDLLLSFLPLSHTFERTVGYYLPMMCGATVAYARSIPQLQEDLQTVRPTILISVPRIYERIYAGVQTKLAEGSAFVRWLFNFAVDVGYSFFEYRQKRVHWRLVFLLWPLLDKLVAAKLINKLGGRLRHAMSGGAALSAEISRVFIGLGLPILQGYGMTESSPTVSVNRHDDNVPSSVGVPISGVEVKLGEDNALLIRGPNVMMGYWNNPQATEAVLSSDGWLNSGDIATIDAQGHITITGRLKDIIVLSTGEKVPPGDMEAAIMRDLIFDQALVIGEARPYLCALVVLNPENWSKFVREHNLDKDATYTGEKAHIEEILLERVTQQTREFPGYARIRKVIIISEPWSIENEMMTPTLKLKRARIMEQYKAEIEKMYEGH
ncbi:MAG: long-chain fatty acid--CoA ligase [Burkholderiales bacterium]|uniref:AMP-dependent synthetase/ligase n=1 Tax=Nitrosomonas sp. TaxID=42353 RepID=UPI001D8592A0|nr:long-chain fatty acid--CoA ligase [Nitrosomonas sp.]MCB1949563.1 long-chain fatty acid--CoA ligase [Nitrosomonas sp.]MCP5242592.1 long-chain fatty acid--CoA ligase [Burkholderiales bacterium]